MSSPVVVFTVDQDNPERGEIKRFDNLEFAERFIEAQVEAGVPSETLKVFKAVEIPVVVTYRPVVSLTPLPESGEESGVEEPVERRPYERHGERLSAALQRPEEV
jgi:hypothetical protein